VTCISRQLRNELVMTPITQRHELCSQHFFNLRHHQIPAAVSLTREAQSQGASFEASTIRRELLRTFPANGGAANSCPREPNAKGLWLHDVRLGTKNGAKGRSAIDGMDRPRSCPKRSQSVRGLLKRRSTAMPRTSTIHAITVIGIDMGKSTL
jgi:hypothetical protein